MCGPYFNQRALRVAAEEASEFHVHIYWDEAGRAKAEAVVKQLIESFPGSVEGSLKPIGKVGPHMKTNFAVHVAPEKIQEVAHVLALHAMYERDASILVHPRTGNEWTDHVDKAVWIGEETPLNMAFLNGHKPKTLKGPKVG